ncbi:protostome-specific GEF isoform X3 [Anticarsia gemmatalis]|uniref:protostome-specific GEF isoform X3 n=1 Tax=Anticarsia gemmatalis TaxID=129554 RepID=UPI003F75E3C3
MLKWAVYGKKNQELRSNELDNEDCDYPDGPYNNNNKIRRSLDAQTVKKSKKPSRYQRRSLGSTAARKNLKAVDKENVNYIGNTPNYFKEGFVKKAEGLALKDVSNITPTGTPVKSYERRKYYLNSSKDDIPPDLPPTPPTYSRRVREAKKRKLEMASANDVFRRDSCVYKSERRIKSIDRKSFSPKLSHSTSEPSLNELSDRLSATTTSSRNSFALGKQVNNPVCTTKTTTEGLVEIEYDEDLVINCIEKPLPIIPNSTVEKTTLPIFGHHIFMDNPLYFNNNDIGLTNIRPLKRTRKKTNDFESSFKSPSVDKKDAHALVREGCSPVSITPLSTKLAALRFSTISTHSKSQRVAFTNDVTDYFPKVENPFTIPLRDEESSTEMENKFILGKDTTNNDTGSTVSTTQMGDVTLERMIEDIIKSTKIIKSKRRILNKVPGEEEKRIEEEVPSLDTVKDLFVNPQAENKANLIKEAKYVNLSRENSVSPKNTPTKKMPIHRVNDRLLKNLPIGCFILDDGDGYNEREVRTPDNAIDVKRKASSKKRFNVLSRSQSMNMSVNKSNLGTVSSESTPDLYSMAEERASLRLKRQRCIRRKKSTVSNESQWKQKDPKTSILTLDIGIPSPATELPNTSLCEPLSPPLSHPTESDDYQNISIKSDVSHSSLMPYDNAHNKRSRELFGLTLEHGIPSPITPVPNLKRPGKVLSEERAHKTSKLDEDLLPTEAFTPVIEHKSIRRCLTYSPEEYSISSSEEKRRSVASNRLERSSERFQALKGTIDLEIMTRNDVIDVHVIRCRDLQRSTGKTDDINAYAKVVISGVSESQSLPPQRSIFQRTSVLYGKREPEFQRHLKLPLPTAIYDHQMLHISVWHRDKKYRRSEFLGCVSFPLKDAINCDISGTYFLQQGSGRGQNATQALANDRFVKDSVTEGDTRKMATDNIETSTNDGTKENHNDKGVSTNGPASTTASQAQAVAAALQREADEHLFLRYLELDPPEDPNAPRRAQRNGRTPFTTTRKLVRGTGGGFGFTVVWTRPPRVERVAAGGSAERAGLRAGDYLVFVGNKNVVTANEEEVRNLVKSAGQMLNIETFRRVPPNGVGIRPRLAQVTIPPAESTPPPPPRSPRAAALASPATAARPPTACSSTSQSLDRRKLHLPQVTFSKESSIPSKQDTNSTIGQQTPGLSTDGRKRALLAVVAREQHYATCLQFGLVRFVSPLAERADLIAPNDHQLLFQNVEEIFRLSEDILDQVVQDDGEIQTSTVVAVYLQKTPVFLSLYKKYCLGLKRADCVLVKKSKDPSGAFSRFCTSPPIPRRRPDITSLVHKPLEQFRELLRLMRAAAAATGAGPYDQLEKKQLQVIVEQLQTGYQDVTAGSGLMGLAGDGKPLLSVADLESRLVFTRCKPFVLSTAGRQWIFGGELSRVEGRAVRPYWALLFSDLLLFATVSRDRVLFVTEEPVALGTVSEAQFNVRKKATEFRLILGRTGGESPLVSCAPRTPQRARTLALRAPSIDLKAVWQSLLQRQIYRAHTMSGTPLGSPLDSPDPQLTFSLATLDSQQRQTRRSSVETQTGAGGSATEGARSTRSRGSTLHLQRWMTQLPEAEEMDPPEPDMEMWSVEELRKRSKELNLLEVADLVISNEPKGSSPCEKKEVDRSPSKSSNSGSQITVRTSPVVVDTIPVCRQCHKKCLSKPNSPLVSQKEPPVIPAKPKTEASPQNSNSNKSSASACSANCGNRKPKNFSHLERKGAIKIRPEDAPKAALKVIDSIEQSQRMLKSTSYELKTDSPILSRSVHSSHTKSQLELRKENSIRSPSPSSSSRNSPLSTSHTTCSSMVFNSSSNDLRMSNSNIANQVQCVIAQEKYLNEVKCVESITLTKTKTSTSNYPSPASARKEQITRQKAENVLNKVLGMNIITKRENVGTCLKTSSVFLEDDSIHEDDNDFKIERGLRRSPRMGISAVSKMNGDINKKTDDINANNTIDGSDEDLELGPLMLMGLSAINPAAHLMRVEPFKRGSAASLNNPCSRPGSLGSAKSESPVPNIAVVPPTPDYNSTNKTDDLVDESPDSPDVPDDLPYVTLKRYGTMSSLERLPSDETDDGNVRLTAQEPETSKPYNAEIVPVSGAAGGIMGWTARAGSFVVEKMNIFSYTESVPNTSIAHKQPSFLERCLGVSDWKSAIGTEEGTGETGEGSGASGEEAWGTPSSGDLSDNLPDSEHGTLSSSSSYAGDDDTELMMDELLMAPTITGPTTLRPLLPRDVFRRRLEPLMEEECSDSGSDDNKATPTNSDDQGSERGLDADDCCDAPHPPPSASEQEPEGGGAGAAADAGGERGGGAGCQLSPDRTPTNEAPSTPLLSVSKEFAEVRAAVGAGRRGSASSDSTPSTLERTTIHNPTTTTATHHQPSPVLEPAQALEATSQPEEQRPQTPERLSPRAEMRLALDQGKDMLADQEPAWVRRGGGSDPWSFRAACQRSLLRRVASADAVTLCRAHPRRTVPHTTSRNSVYAWKVPENEKLMEMEQLARAEVQTMRSRTRSLCQNGKIMGFLRRRASSDSPRREPFIVTATRPFSPRRTTEKQFEKRFWKQVTRRRQSLGSISQI